MQAAVAGAAGRKYIIEPPPSQLSIVYYEARTVRRRLRLRQTIYAAYSCKFLALHLTVFHLNVASSVSKILSNPA